MVSTIQIVLGLLAIVLMFLPAALLIYASIKLYQAIGRPSAWLLSVGALLLTITSLDFLYTAVLAQLFGPAELAAFTVVSTYTSMALRYLALLAIGFGLLIAARQLKKRNPSIDTANED